MLSMITIFWRLSMSTAGNKQWPQSMADVDGNVIGIADIWT